MSDRVPVRDDLVDVTPYGAPQLDVAVRLNTNETAAPPPQDYLDAVAEEVRGLALHRYPDRPATALRTALAEVEGLDPSAVWVANGSNEILLQLFQAYGGTGRRMLLFRPGYSAHPLIARVAATEVVEHDLDDSFRLDAATAREAVADHDPDLTVIASPNNPSGVPTSVDAVEALHEATRGLVVVDEAYVEFARHGGSVAGLLDRLPRLVVTRTFSKAYRLAGLRLGYLLAHDWVVDDLRRVRLPYHVDAIKQAAGIVAVRMRDRLTDHIEGVVSERERVRERLLATDGVDRVWPSDGNFLLFRTDIGDLFDRLLARDVLVRDFSTRPRLEGCLRVTIGTPEENDAFLAALAAALEETP